VRLSDDDTGTRAIVTGPQASHQLTSMLGADGLVIVAAGTGELPAGAAVQVEPIR
jgi:molybdopterin biosynthesis enzyme